MLPLAQYGRRLAEFVRGPRTRRHSNATADLRADSSTSPSGPHDEGSLRSRVTPLRAVLLLTGVASIAPLLVGVVAQTPGPCDPPNGNHIQCENVKPGNPASEWDISGAGSNSIQGYATDISVDQGQTVRFKIDIPMRRHIESTSIAWGITAATGLARLRQFSRRCRCPNRNRNASAIHRLG